MKQASSRTDSEIIALLKRGAVGVLPTDTVYGVVASAAHPAAIERLYEIRDRSSLKGCITLIAHEDQLDEFVAWNEFDRQLASTFWPGPVSIILSVGEQTPEHLHPVDGTLAFRLPADEDLLALLRQVGPLLAPSANPPDLPPATTLAQAYRYFGDAVDFYVDAGDLSANQPSTLIRQRDGRIEVLRGSLPNS
jgi:L-threonylcarbamoyladenylate synthase